MQVKAALLLAALLALLVLPALPALLLPPALPARLAVTPHLLWSWL